MPVLPEPPAILDSSMAQYTTLAPDGKEHDATGARDLKRKRETKAEKAEKAARRANTAAEDAMALDNYLQSFAEPSIPFLGTKSVPDAQAPATKPVKPPKGKARKRKGADASVQRRPRPRRSSSANSSEHVLAAAHCWQQCAFSIRSETDPL